MYILNKSTESDAFNGNNLKSMFGIEPVFEISPCDKINIPDFSISLNFH